MKTTLKFSGMEFSGRIVREAYQEGGAPALAFVAEDGEPIATLTINLSGMVALAPNETFIKDYSENAGLLAQLVEQGIVRDTGGWEQTGFVQAPIVEIIAEGLRQ